MIKKTFLFATNIIFFVLFSFAGISLALQLTVEIRGVEGKEKENVLALLEIYREKDLDISAARAELLFKKGYVDIKRALEPFGFFAPSIEGRLEKGGGDGPWKVVYEINQGKAARISLLDVSIQGPGAKLLSDITPSFREGDRFVQTEYERFKDELLRKAMAHGFLDAVFQRHEVLVDAAKSKVEIHLHLKTGPRYRFGEMTFEQTGFSSEFLRSFADFQAGDPFDTDRLSKFRTRLLDSDYFRDVRIDYSKERSKQDERIPLVITCPMKKPNVYRLGLGYVSDVGPRISLEWRRRYLTHRGHHLRTRFQFSPEETLVSGEYFVPLSRPYSDYFSIKPFVEHYDTKSRTGWKYNVAVLYSKAVTGGWRRNAGLNLGYENYETGGERNDNRELIPFVSWYKSESDNVLYANRGYSVKLGLSGEIGGLLANASYLSSFFKGKVIRRLSPDYRLIARLDLGATAAADVEDLPSSSRFYAGGQNSIRGFSLEELGPVNPDTGDVTGGRYLAVGSMELERHLYGPVSGAVFVDAGNSFDPGLDNSIEIGTGVGLRLKTILGPVRLDFGFGVSEDPVPFRFYLSVGPDF